MRLTILFLFIACQALAQMPVVVGVVIQKKGPGPSLGDNVFVNDNVTGTGNNQTNYSAGWTAVDPQSQMYGGTVRYSNTTNATATFTCDCRRIRWMAPKYLNHGIAGVTVDGGSEQLIDQYDPIGFNWTSEPDKTIIFDRTFPTQGSHTVVIRVTGQQNIASTGAYVFTDGWIVNSDDIPVPPSTGDYYVGGSGASDNNAGTSIAPFATIQKAATVARAGDVVKIRSGTYREAIFPVNSGTSGNEIIYEADAGATVIVSGFELAGNTGWTVHSGNIYKKTITLPVTGYRTAPAGMYTNGNQANAEITNTYIFANQIIKNGEMIIEASYPKGLNSQDDYFKMDATNNVNTAQWIARSQTGFTDLSPTGVTDTHMDATPGSGWWTFSTNALTGATMIGQGWYISHSGTITSNNGTNGRINWAVHNSRYGGPGAFWKFYRLTNSLQFLTQANEFYYGGGVLYVWQPGGGSPTDIEYKARNWGFDLRNKQYIKIRGIQFIGCEPVTGNAATSYITIDNIRAKFMNHNLTHSAFLDQGHGMGQFMGTKLCGTNNTVINSEFSYSANMAIWISQNGLVQNNKFDHIGYDGMWGACVALWGFDNINNVRVLNNTATALGRGFVDTGFASGPNMGQADGLTKNLLNMEIAYNDVSDLSKRCLDGGMFYSWGYQNTAGMNFHHNWQYNHTSFGDPDGSLNDGILAGYYGDMGSGANVGDPNGAARIHHNVFWNNDIARQTTEVADILVLPKCNSCCPNGSTANPGCVTPAKMPYKIYNNNLTGTKPTKLSTYGTRSSWDILPSWTYNSVTYTEDYQNNIATGQIFTIGTTKPAYFRYGLYYPPFASASEDPKFQGGDISNPGAYFQLQSTSPGRGAASTLAGFNDDDTGPKDIGAYPYGQPAWTTPGYNAVTYTPTP